MHRTPFAVVRDGIPGWERDGRFYPIMAGADGETDPPTTPTEPTSAEPASTPAPAPELTGPWAQDLERAFTDPAVRSQVDDFMRTTYQPYVTNLETQKAELEQAAGLVEALREDPVGTYLELTNLIGGEELAEQVRTLLTPEEQAQVDALSAAASTPGQTLELPPEVQELIEEREQQKAMETYEEQLEELGLSDDEREIFHPLVIAHNGDIAAAYAAWPTYLAQVKSALGIDEPSDPSPSDVPDPPPVLGSDTRSGSTPPLEQKPKSLDEALDNFFSSKAPQAVGTA